MKKTLLVVGVLMVLAPTERFASADSDCGESPLSAKPQEVDPSILSSAGVGEVSKMQSVQSWYTHDWFTDELYVAIGPDGSMLGTIPASVREDAHIVVAVFKAPTMAYEVSISGCTQTSTRILGQPAAAARPAPANPPPATASYAELYTLGHCSADKQVSIQVKITGGACNAKTATSTFQTSSVFNLTVGYGIALFGGYRNDVGVDAGVGGAPSIAFQRRVRRGVQDRLLVAWFPLGYAPTTDLFEREQGQNRFVSLARRASIGTFIDVSNPTASFNLNLGLEIVQGLQVFLGADFCDKETTLGGGLRNGSVFGDDSSKLPTSSSLVCHTEAYFGIAGTADLVAKLFK